MTIDVLDQLAVLLKHEHDAFLARWRLQVRQLPSARTLDVPTLNDHIPGLLDELAAALQSKSDQTIPEALCEGSPPAHGLQRLQEAFDIEEVVAEYNILRGCIHDLADDNGLNLQGRPFHIINRVLDRAIGLALQTYATQRALEVQRRREEYLAFYGSRYDGMKRNDKGYVSWTDMQTSDGKFFSNNPTASGPAPKGGTGAPKATGSGSN